MINPRPYAGPPLRTSEMALGNAIVHIIAISGARAALRNRRLRSTLNSILPE